MASSAVINRERRRLRQDSMDDWYLEVCKRNANKLSFIDAAPTPHAARPRSGSFKHTVTFVPGK